MKQEISRDVIKKIIFRLEGPNQPSRAILGQLPEDEMVRAQVKRAVEKLAQDPEAIQG